MRANPGPNTTFRRALVALVLLLAACGSSSDDAEAAADADTAAPTTAAPTDEADTDDGATTGEADADDGADQDTAGDESAEADTTGASATSAEPPAFQPDAELLTDEFNQVRAGTYRVDTVGTPFSFTIGSTLAVQPNSDAFFVLTAPSSQGPGDRDIVIMRLSNLSDPTQPNAGLEVQRDGWPADDFAGWLDNLSDVVVVSNRESTTLGGVEAVRADLQLSDGVECSEEPEYCVGFGHNRLINGKSLDPGAMYKVWVVDQGEESPLAVIVGIRREGNAGWFDTADEVLSTLAFGEVEPNPIPSEGDLWTLGFSTETPAGSVILPALGGVAFDLAEDSFIFQASPGFTAIQLNDQPADSELISIAADKDGTPLTTIDAAVEVLTEFTSDLTELDARMVGGIEARVFDFADGLPLDIYKVDLDEEDGWRPPPRGRVWMMEHPDRGVIMVTAEAFENVGVTFPLVLERTEGILDSFEFVELG